MVKLVLEDIPVVADSTVVANMVAVVDNRAEVTLVATVLPIAYTEHPVEVVAIGWAVGIAA